MDLDAKGVMALYLAQQDGQLALSHGRISRKTRLLRLREPEGKKPDGETGQD